MKIFDKDRGVSMVLIDCVMMAFLTPLLITIWAAFIFAVGAVLGFWGWP